MFTVFWSSAQRLLERGRPWGLAVAMGVGSCVLLTQVHQHYPVQQWIFWRYLAYWLAAAALWVLATGVGDRLVRWVRGRRLPAREHFAIAFPLGLLASSTLIFLAGVAHAFGRWFFFGFPLLLALVSGRSFLRFLARFARRAWARPAGPRPWAELSLALGVVAALFAYAPIMSPANIAYDARWYHMPIAEHYAAQGSITRFPEGWTLGAYPQLVTLLSTWAMQLPVGQLFDRVMLVLHFEWVTFLATLAAIPPLVRRLVPGASGYRSWLFVFLFPGLFLYDSNLNGSADHFLAATAPAIWLTLLRAGRRFEPRACALFGLSLAAAANTKYTALSLVVPACIGLGLRLAWLRFARARAVDRAARPKLWWGSAAAAAAFLVATSTHWLKNLIFYGDPLFPALNRWLKLRPWVSEASVHYQKFMLVQGTWHPPSTLQGVRDTLRTAVTFAFVPNDWPSLHGSVPVFGMLFTLCLLALPFCRRSARLWGIALASELGILLWYWTNHQDRYLQALVPWLAAFTAAVFSLAYRSGLPSRITAGFLIGAQAIWGSDVPFIPTHAMVGDTPLRETARLLGQGYLKQYATRLAVSEFEAVAAALPKGAKVLLHNQHEHLGLGAASISDWAPFQSGLSYAELRSPRGVFDKLTSFGATHVLYVTQPNYGMEFGSLAAELVFWETVALHTETPRSIGRFTLVKLPAIAPAASSEQRFVMYLGCDAGNGYRSGLYELGDLRHLYDQPFSAPRETEASNELGVLLARASFVVLADCRNVDGSLLHDFRQLYRRADSTLYGRP